MTTFNHELRTVAQELSLPLSDDQEKAIERFVERMAKWNKVYNLTAIRVEQDIWSHHVYDSMAALASVDDQVGVTKARHVLDVGSGGGLPGVIWSILRADWKVTCIDAVAKKVAFIQQVINATPLVSGRLNAVHARVQEHQGAYDVVTSRAFASLSDFTNWTAHLLKPGGLWLAMKGKWPDDEINALPEGIEVFHVKQLHVPHLDEERWLIWLRPTA